MTVRKQYMLEVLKVVCRHCADEPTSELVVNFVLKYADIDNACDLLRECKQWPWNTDKDALTKMRDPNEVPKMEVPGGGATQEQSSVSLKGDMSEEEIFAALDVNNDGVVSKEEFTAFKKALTELSYNYVKEWKIPNL